MRTDEMLPVLHFLDAHCPCCGELLELTVDCSGGDRQYVEDCQICCAPILIDLGCDSDELNPSVQLRPENE
jgi:hypothetical protein